MNITDPNIWIAATAVTQAVATIVLVLVTIYYAKQAHDTVDEMRTARKQSLNDQGAAKKEQIESVHILMEEEVKQNLLAARDFWRYASSRDSSPIETLEENKQIAFGWNIVHMPEPSFSYVARNSQFPLLPIALKPETIGELWGFYAKLDRILYIRKLLFSLYSERDADSPDTPLNFYMLATEWVQECKKNVDGLESMSNFLSIDNPK